MTYFSITVTGNKKQKRVVTKIKKLPITTLLVIIIMMKRKTYDDMLPPLNLWRYHIDSTANLQQNNSTGSSTQVLLSATQLDDPSLNHTMSFISGKRKWFHRQSRILFFKEYTSPMQVSYL